MAYIGSTPTTQSFIAGTDYFNGTGAQVAFTLSRSVNSVNDIEVIVNNVEQIPSGYSVSGTTLTFSAAPSAGTSNVYVRYLSTTNLSLAIPAGTSATFNTVGVTGNLAFTGTGNRITGDFSNGTIANRVLLQNSTTNGNTSVGAVPNGTAVIANYIAYNSTDPANSSYIQTLISATEARINSGQLGTGTNLPMIFSTGGSERVRIDTSGNVGIGTSSPANIVGIIGPPATSFISIQRSDEAGFGGRVGCGNSLYGPATTRSLGLDGFSSISFGIAGTERARIDSSGNLLVGTTSQIATVSRFTLGVPNNTQWGISMKPTDSDGGYRAVSFANFSSTNIGAISCTTTATSYVTSSDYRLKEAIAPMTGALAKVGALKPVTYKWKATGETTNGFIAHELAEIVPECVVGEKDAVDADGNPQYQGIDTSFLVATLTAAIQEQQTLITALTARITALEAK